METHVIHALTETFEGHAQQTEEGIEYWLARDLQTLLGYHKWTNFLNVISKARTGCEISGHEPSDHFADVGKMVRLGSGTQREVDDLMLTRYACYLIAQNGDASKPPPRRFCADHRAQSQGLRRRDHHPQRPDTALLAIVQIAAATAAVAELFHVRRCETLYGASVADPERLYRCPGRGR